MRIAFLGSPAVAVTTLLALVDAGHDVAHVVTQPDRRRGRGAGLIATPVKAAALERGIGVSYAPDDLLTLSPPVDLAVVVAFGQLIRPHVLAAVPMLNVHFSLLPRWRGAAPVERALLAGDETTGVCIMGVEEGLDTGPVYAQAELAITADHTAESLRAELAGLGNELLVELLRAPLPTPVAQSGPATYARKLEGADRHFDPALRAAQLDRVVRVGGAWCNTERGRLKIHAAAQAQAQAQSQSQSSAIVRVDGAVLAWGSDAADGPALVLHEVQPEGRPRMSASAWWMGLQGADLVTYW